MDTINFRKSYYYLTLSHLKKSEKILLKIINVQRGGVMNTRSKKKENKNIEIYVTDISKEQWNKGEIDMLRNLGYKGKIKITKSGMVERIGFEKILDNVNKNKFKLLEKINKDFLDKLK